MGPWLQSGLDWFGRVHAIRTQWRLSTRLDGKRAYAASIEKSGAAFRRLPVSPMIEPEGAQCSESDKPGMIIGVVPDSAMDGRVLFWFGNRAAGCGYWEGAWRRPAGESSGTLAAGLDSARAHVGMATEWRTFTGVGV